MHLPLALAVKTLRISRKNVGGMPATRLVDFKPRSTGPVIDNLVENRHDAHFHRPPDLFADILGVSRGVAEDQHVSQNCLHLYG